MVLDYDAKHPGYRVIHDGLRDMKQVTSTQTYQKGAWTLHMLRGLVGTETFWRGIQSYYRLYLNGNATTDDFRRVMERASGRPLDWFFRQWLTRSGAPTVEGEWRFDSRAGVVRLALRQTQPGEPFRLPIEVGIREGGQLRIERIELDGGAGSFELPVEQEPESVSLDPRFFVLMNARLEREGR